MEKKVIKIDPYQRAAIDTEINSVVSAGAGSGKTSVLSERFSHLVMDKGYNVDQILTLTFTKEATVEMSSRIYRSLKEHNSPQAADFYKANIKTIDAYCAAVAKTGAHLYGVSPDFAQSDDLTASIGAMALPFLLEHRDNEAIKALVNTKDYESKAYEIFVSPILNNSTVAEPVDFWKSLEYQIETIISAWNEKSKTAKEAVLMLGNALQAFEGNRGTAMISYLEKTMAENELPALHEYTSAEIKAADSSCMDALLSYLSAVASVRLSGAKGSEEIKDIINRIRNEIIPVIDSIRNFVTGMPLTLNLLPLMEEFQEKVNDFKRRTGQLTFKDIASLATCILRDYPELRQIEKEKYKAIMIDEFQDNNSQQRDLLFMLSEKPDRHEKGVPAVEDLCPDKLFFVGDEKQSIYRFRGADVSVFRGLSRDFKDGNLSMATNYRSNPALIACFNTVFGGFQYPPVKENKEFGTAVFYNDSDQKRLSSEGVEIPDYEAVYHRVTMSEDNEKAVAAMNDKELEKTFSPRLHLALYEKDQEAQPGQLTESEAEARWVAQKIRKLIDEEGYKPEEIAILFRDYAFQPLYERTLLNSGIPYNTLAVSGFFADGPVNDIFAVLRLCAYPEDTFPYAQLLRSPLVNLTAAETEYIMNQQAGLFEADVSALSEDSLRRYNHFKDAFLEIQKTAKESSITDTVTAVWYKLGYRYETMWNQTVELYGKMYDLVFELCRQADKNNLSMSEFVDSMNTYQDQKARLEGLNIPLEQVSGVNIMTIHKSKGLEFRAVFICGTQKGSGHDVNNETTYSSRQYGITINTPGKSNYFFNLVKDLNGKMEAAELRRITYVALTRAKEQLFITNAKYEQKEDAEEKYAPGGTAVPRTIWNVLEPVVNCYLNKESQSLFTVEAILPQDRDAENTSTIRRNTEEDRKIFLHQLETENPFSRAEIFTKETLESKYCQPSQLHGADDETRTAAAAEINPSAPYPEITRIVLKHKEKFDFTNFGTIAHSYMEALINGTEAAVSAKDAAGLEDDKEAVSTIDRICREMQEKFKNSSLGKAAVSSKWHKAEYEFRSRVGNKIVKGIMDLVFQDKNGRYTIVDYKTNQEKIPEIYYSQLACYRQAIASMLNVKNPEEIRCMLYYLRFGEEADISDKCSEEALKTD